MTRLREVTNYRYMQPLPLPRFSSSAMIVKCGIVAAGSITDRANQGFGHSKSCLCRLVRTRTLKEKSARR